jgi:hypothetical protein
MRFHQIRISADLDKLLQLVVAPSESNSWWHGLGGTQTQCQSPGNVQVNDAAPQVNYFPLGDS